MSETEVVTSAVDPARPAVPGTGLPPARAPKPKPGGSAGGGTGAGDRAPAIEGRFRVGWRRFRRHKPGLCGLAVLALFYFVAAFADFIAPYSFENEAREAAWAPSNVRFQDGQGFSLRPFVYPLRVRIDEEFKEVVDEDRSQRLYVRFFVVGDEHRLLGVIPTRFRLMGVDPLTQSQTDNKYYARMYLMGSDIAGRDVFSRICYGSRVSMSIGLVGSLFVLVIGLSVGGAMGYFGGRTDDLLYSFSQMIMLLPGFYLLLMLRYMFPANMDSAKVYFAIILILSLVGWPGFALVIRGMVKAIRAMDFVQAARAMGLGHARIIARHVLPNTTGYVVVATTLRIPGYILGESALSFLGLGITDPTPSWGNMLQNTAKDISDLNQHPWVLWPGAFIFLAVMAFNLVGDGLRDALDPNRPK